jgi:hypothetical protein
VFADVREFAGLPSLGVVVLHCFGLLIANITPFEAGAKADAREGGPRP